MGMRIIFKNFATPPPRSRLPECSRVSLGDFNLSNTKLIMKKRIFISMFLLTGFQHLQAAVWSAGGDLRSHEMTPSDTINPNGQWTYGYRSTVLSSSLTLFTNNNLEHDNSINSVVNLQGWNTQLGDPNIAANTSSVPLPLWWSGQSLGVDELLMHPGPGNSASTFVVARWTAPANGTFYLNSSWKDLDSRFGDGFSAELVHVNSSSIASSLFGANVSNGASTSTSLSIALTAGEHLDFIVGTGAAGDYLYDTTGLTATIDGVPEPSSMLLGALGFVVAAFRRKR